MSDLTPQEQLMLELVNRARMDPAGEAKRFHITPNEGLKAGTISNAPKQVLAGNDFLAKAADNHSSWMIRNDVFAHEETKKSPGFTGVEPWDRMGAAGYDFTGAWTAGENIAFRSGNSIGAKIIEQEYRDLFVDKGVSGRGHRTNILGDDFQEVGIGVQLGKFSDGGFDGNVVMTTQDFASSGSKAFVTGVVYNDTVKNDDFYTIGEQVKGVAVSGSGASDKTGSGGGYELEYDSGGAKKVTFDLSGGSITVGLKLGSTNAKVDVVNGDEVWTDHSLTSVSKNVAELHALGIAKISLDGAASGQAMFGNNVANTIKGNGGNDTIDGGRGIDKLYGGSGADTFVFAKGDTAATHGKADTIYDFKAGDHDKIDLSHWDADAIKKGRQDFDFIGSDAFSKHAGELHVVTTKSATWIEGDTNGDGKADFAIHLIGAMTLSGNSFDL